MCEPDHNRYRVVGWTQTPAVLSFCQLNMRVCRRAYSILLRVSLAFFLDAAMWFNHMASVGKHSPCLDPPGFVYSS